MFKHILFSLSVALISFKAYAIDPNQCYSFTDKPAFGQDDLYISGFCSQKMTEPTSGDEVLAVALIIHSPSQDQSGPWGCGGADYVQIVDSAKYSDVDYGLDEPVIRFSKEPGQGKLGSAEIAGQNLGSYALATPAQKAAMIAVMNKGFRDHHCELKEPQPDSNLRTVIEPKNLKFDLSRSDLNSKDLQASMNVSCRFDVGFWPFNGSKDCGNFKRELEFNGRGELVVPRVGVSGDIGSKNLDNYDFEIKITDVRGRNIAWLSSTMNDHIMRFNEFNKTLKVIKLNRRALEVTYKGERFFATQLPLLNDASLHIALEVRLGDTIYPEGFSMFDTINWYNLGGNNRSYTGEDQKLKYKKAFNAPDTYLVTQHQLSDLTLRYYASYESASGPDARIKAWNSIQVPLLVEQDPPLTLDLKDRK